MTSARSTVSRAPDPLALLKALPMFRAVGDEAMRALAAGTQPVQLTAGDLLFRRGAPCTGFHVVVDGLIKLTLEGADGAEKVIDIVGAGKSFGEAVMFLDKPYYVCAEACADSLLLHVDKDVVFGLVDRDPLFARRMLAGLSARLHELVRDVESYSLRSGTQRVIAYLLDEAPSQPRAPGAVVVLPVKKGIIASRLNLTQEHFSRILHDLANRGLIRIHGREITIPDLGALREAGAA